MSAIFLPIILIVAALSVILVVFSRHLPDITRGLKEETKEKITPDAISELSINPKAYKLTQPSQKKLSNVWVKIAPAVKYLTIKMILVAKISWSAVKYFGRFAAKIFHRVPRVQPVLAAFKRDSREIISKDNKDAEVSDVKSHFTTADIKVAEKNPMRYPEPLSDSLVVLTQPKKTDQGRRERKNLRQEKFATKQQEMKVNEEKKQIAQQLPTVEKDYEKQPVFTVEATKETRTSNRRRIVGTVTAKQPVVPVQDKTTLKDDFYEVTDLAPDMENKNITAEPVLPLAIKKVSFLDREAVTLSDSTQEISKQIQQGNLNQAESALIDVLSKNPRDTEAYRLLGIVYLKRKDFVQAREVFEEALRRDPDHGGLHGPLGFCYMSAGEYGKALSMYQQAHNLDEDNIEYLEQLLIISARMDRRPLVKMVAKKILALDPNHAEAKKYLERIAVR